MQKGAELTIVHLFQTLGRRMLTRTAKVIYATMTATMMGRKTKTTTVQTTTTQTRPIGTETRSGTSVTCVLMFITMDTTQTETEKLTPAMRTLMETGKTTRETIVLSTKIP